MKDPAFVAEAAKLQFDVDPLTGEQVQVLVAQLAATPARGWSPGCAPRWRHPPQWTAVSRVRNHDDLAVKVLCPSVEIPAGSNDIEAAEHDAPPDEGAPP